MILPPFPFPDQWERVAQIQAINNETYWLVPSYYHYPANDLSLQGEETNDYPQTYIDGEDDLEDYELELNEEWAERLARTIDRLNRKDKPSVYKIQTKNTKKNKKRRKKRNKAKISNAQTNNTGGTDTGGIHQGEDSSVDLTEEEAAEN